MGQTMGNDRQWAMSDNVEWQAMGNDREWEWHTMGNDRQWAMSDNGQR